MMFINHQAFGLGTGILIHNYFAEYIPVTERYIAIPLIMLGILLPDIDTPKSVVGRIVPIISYPIEIIFGHRSITHGLLFCIGMSYYGLSADSVICFWLGFGALMHILGDFFTPSGVPLLWPITVRFRFLVTFTTGGVAEPVFAWGVLFASLFMLATISL